MGDSQGNDTGVPRNRSHLPQTVPHFVNRERECELIRRCLEPAHECRCILLHGPPGIGKTALAIKAANDRLEADKNTVVVYVNCKYIYSSDDFAEKVLVQIYHYPLNNPICGMKTRLINNEFSKYTIMLLDNFEFLLHVDDCIENPQMEIPGGRMKAKDFVAELIANARNVKLLVTSSENVEFPALGKEKISVGAFEPKETFQLLKTVCKDRRVDKTCANQLSDICCGIPLVLYTLISSQDDLVSRLLQMSCSEPEERFEHLKKIKVVPKEDKINVCLDICFDRLNQQEQNTLLSLTLLKGWFTPSGAAKVFQSKCSSERQFIGHVLKLANCSLLVQNITAQGIGRYTFLSLIREHCKRKEMEQRFCRVFNSARNLCIDYFLNFLKDTFKVFLSKNALKAITDFQQEEENIMQLLEWLDKDQMDEERINACIDAFNTVGELLAKMMSKRKFKSKYDLLKKKCEDKGDQQRLSECLTSLGIKEVFNCTCTPGLCDEACKRAKTYLEKADRIQNNLGIDSGNSRAQCLAKLGRCLARECDPRGKRKIKEAIRIRLNDQSDDVCRVMLGATHNDMAVALSLEKEHRRAIKIREEQTLPIYREILADHPFTATIYNNLSNNFYALGEFDKARPNSEIALKIRRKLLKDHTDTAKSLFDLGMVLKAKGDFQQAITYLEQSMNMQEKVLEDSLKDLQRTKQQLEDARTLLDSPGAFQPPDDLLE